MSEVGTRTLRGVIPQVASRLKRPTVGPKDQPGTSVGSNFTLSPLQGYLRAGDHPRGNVWVSRISGHLRTQGYEDADSLRSLKCIHSGSVDWKLIVNSAVSVLQRECRGTFITRKRHRPMNPL